MTFWSTLKKPRALMRKITFIYEPYRKGKARWVRKNKAKMLHQEGYHLLDDIVCALSQTSLKVFCGYGTLLGFVREGSFIQHDDDIDFCIAETDGFSWYLLETVIKAEGLKKVKEFKYHDQITEQVYSRDGFLTVDFFLYQQEDDGMRVYDYCKERGKNYNTDNELSVRSLKTPQ